MRRDDGTRAKASEDAARTGPACPRQGRIAARDTIGNPTVPGSNETGRCTLLGPRLRDLEACLPLTRSDLTEAQEAQRSKVNVTTFRDTLNKSYCKLDIHRHEALVERLTDAMHST